MKYRVMVSWLEDGDRLVSEGDGEWMKLEEGKDRMEEWKEDVWDDGVVRVELVGEDGVVVVSIDRDGDGIVE